MGLEATEGDQFSQRVFRLRQRVLVYSGGELSIRRSV
jgi:hypothetical protein